MPGVSIETGDTVWDPMNLAQWRDPAEMRECELKNGRAAMLAVVGWIWPQVFGLWAANDVTTADPIGYRTGERARVGPDPRRVRDG